MRIWRKITVRRDLKIKEAWKKEREKEEKERGRGERRNKGVW